MVSAVATDAVHQVAEAPPAALAEVQRRADARIRAVLGPEVRISWSEAPDGPAIEIRVTGSRLPGLATDIQRGAVARRERPW